VGIDESRRDVETGSVDNPSSLGVTKSANRHDTIAVDRNIDVSPRASRPIQHSAVPNEHIVGLRICDERKAKECEKGEPHVTNLSQNVGHVDP
jgi:hypothetical protein